MDTITPKKDIRMNNSFKTNSKLNIFYLVFLIVWQPIKMLTVQIDGKGRIPFLLTLFVLLYNLFANPDVRKLMGGNLSLYGSFGLYMLLST